MAQTMYKRVLWTISFLIAAQFATGQVIPAKNTPWPVIKQQMRPWTRWWWMGNAVDEKNLGTALTTYQQAGIGGVEITPIYGAKGFESRYIKYLSPQWMQMLDFTVKKAHALNMGVDMNTGTGWPFGGPQITPEFAAAKLIIQQYKLTKGNQLAEAIIVKDKKQQDAGAVLQAVTAYGANGDTRDLLDKVDKNGKLNWTDQASDWEIYAVFSGRTLQQVKRAAPGGEGYTLDHLDKPSVDTYLKTFDNAFAGHSPGVRAFFNDSYEVYGANWTPTFFKEFKALKGYDLSKYIKELTGKDSTGAVTGRIKSDYRETMNQLLLDNFTKNWSDWAHRYKSISKNQSHGSPGNLLDLYAAVDIPETETFGSSYFPIPGLRRDSGDIRNVDPDPIMNKFASSAAHTKGKPFASSETLTWLTEHFKTSFSQAKPEAEQLFLAGINHIFYHGTTFTPSDVPFPGWLFYASVNMVPANSLWPHLKGMNDYFSRCQSILQAGRSDNELLVYWPIYDQWANPKGMDMPMKVHDVDVWLHPTEFYKQSLALQGKGYSLDFASDLMLSGSKAVNGKLVTAPGATPYQTLIIPECRFMPVQTLESILSLAKAGATVIFQKLPEDVPGLADLDQKRAMFKQLIGSLKLTTQTGGIQRAAIGTGEILVSNDLPQALLAKHIEGENLISSGLKFIRRQVADGKYYYLVNHTAKTIDQWIPINAVGSSVLILDPQSGNYGQAQLKKEGGKTWVKVNLESGEALFLQSANQKKTDKMWVYLTKPGAAVKLGTTWNLHFTKGGPELPADQQLNKLVSWTATGDPKAESFSGTGEYTQTFVLPAKTAKEYVLSLGEVDESAHVWINGKDAGIIWSFPFRKRIGEYLVQGKNTIKIEVANLMANRMRYMDQKGIQWRNYHEINFVNINYKPFDASVWKVMPSGLLGPVEVKAYN
jgi:hypothetical protein